MGSLFVFFCFFKLLEEVQDTCRFLNIATYKASVQVSEVLDTENIEVNSAAP